MIDSHLHIDANHYETEGGVSEILEKAKSVGVDRVVAPALHMESFGKLQELSAAYPQIFPAVGVHPHEVSAERCLDLASLLSQNLQDCQCPILGETGLEGHYDFVDMELQLKSLRVHLNVAKVHHIPVILHCRNTEELLYRELLRAQLPKAGVVHCFTGSWDWAQKFLELGFYIGLTGVVTFKNSTQVQEVARNLPTDRLLVETDGPYLAPVPFRGKVNKPEYIPYIVEKIADLRNISSSVVADFTRENTENLFGLPKLHSGGSV